MSKKEMVTRKSTDVSSDVKTQTAKKPATEHKVDPLRIILYVVAGFAVLLALFVLIPNTKDTNTGEMFSSSTTVCEMWENQTGVEVHGSVRNNGWKPAFKVTYTITVTEVDDEGMPVYDEKGQEIVIGEYTSEPVFIVWGHGTIPFELKVPFDELHDSGNVSISASGYNFN